MTDAVRVVGLREMRSELRKVGDEFPKELRKANLRVSDLVAEGTRSVFGAMSGSAPKVATVVKALASQGRAQVKVGGGRTVAAQVAMGNLWGSSRFKQFPASTGNRGGGYALYPTIAAKRDEIVEIYADALEDITRRAFPK